MPIRLHLPETRYVIASLPLVGYREVLTMLPVVADFVSVTRDKDEITLVVTEAAWQEFAEKFPGAHAQRQRRMIRFDTVLDFSVVGFIAEISRALAEADISIITISTYRTDAVFVHEALFDDAVRAVKRALITLSYTHLAQH